MLKPVVASRKSKMPKQMEDIIGYSTEGLSKTDGLFLSLASTEMNGKQGGEGRERSRDRGRERGRETEVERDTQCLKGGRHAP